MNKSSKIKERKFFDSILWERVKFGQWDKPFLTFLSILISVFVIIGLIAYFAWLYQTTGDIPLELLIVVILGFQLLFMFIQTINVSSQSKLAKLSNLPHIHVWLDTPKSKKYFIISLRNNGTDALNVSYIVNQSWYYKRKIIKESKFVFSLPNKGTEQIIQLNKEKYFNQFLYIRISYEDLLNNKYFALFKKRRDELTLVNITTGLY